MRDHGQEKGKVSDKGTIFAARNIVNMSELSVITVPSKREECEINILILVRLLK